MKKRIKLDDIAKIAGVSKMTVSLALRGDHSISEATKKHIKEIADDLGYTPNRMAQGLITGRSYNIALIVGGFLHDDYQNLFIKGAIPYALERGYTISIGPAECNPDIEKSLINKYNNMMVDGYLSFHCNNPDTYRELQRKNIPFVLYTKYFPELNTDYVICNDFKGGYDMTKHMIDNGHERIAFVYDTHLLDSSEVLERKRGYIKALTDHGLPFDESLVIPFNMKNYNKTDHDSLVAENGTFTRIMAGEDRPTALFVSNDITASFVYIVVKKLRYSIPNDVSIGGYEGVYLGSIIDPPLTTIHTPIEEIGRRACEILIDKIEGRIPLSQKVKIKLEPSLLSKDSVDGMAARTTLVKS